jgi:predicted RNase H-like HicB family nuclease
MKIKAVVQEAEEGGRRAEVPDIPGRAARGETSEELLKNLSEAVEGCLSVGVSPARAAESDRASETAA